MFFFGKISFSDCVPARKCVVSTDPDPQNNMFSRIFTQLIIYLQYWIIYDDGPIFLTDFLQTWRKLFLMINRFF